jgi:hypothetical protein
MMNKNVVAQVRKATRKKYSAEEKIRMIVLEGVRGEIPISELCRREGIVGLSCSLAPSSMGFPDSKEFFPWGWRKSDILY